MPWKRFEFSFAHQLPGKDLVADGGSGMGEVAIWLSSGCKTVSSSVSSDWRLDLTTLTSRQNR